MNVFIRVFSGPVVALACITAGAPARAQQSNAAPARALESAKECLVYFRETVSAEIERSSHLPTVSGSDLRELLQKLASIRQWAEAAKLPDALDHAVQDAGAAEAQADAIVKTPENRSMLAFDFGALVHQLAAWKSQWALQQMRLATVAQRLEEALAWANATEPVIPPTESSLRLKALLEDVRQQWRQPQAESPLPSAPDAGTDGRGPVAAGDRPRGGEVRPAALDRLSPPARDVLELVQRGVSEPTVLSFINGSRRKFFLDADGIITLRRMGVPPPILVGMIGHDTLLDKR